MTNIKIIKDLDEMLAMRTSIRETVGVVPTMGNLHKGHLSLLKRSLNENSVSIITIFVNPKQFGPTEDFNSYPRTLEEDVQKIKTLQEEVDAKKMVIIFAPNKAEDVFPKDFDTTISIGSKFQNILCGLSRPGHFDGVTTVVYRLFAITNPTQAYFGQKDYQQFRIIQKMCKDLSLQVKLNMLPISREESGLALSSRNRNLSSEEVKEATLLNKTLKSLKAEVANLDKCLEIKKAALEDKRFEYLEILDSETLEAPKDSTKTVLFSGAFKIGQTRLIDNYLVNL